MVAREERNQVRYLKDNFAIVFIFVNLASLKFIIGKSWKIHNDCALQFTL